MRSHRFSSGHADAGWWSQRDYGWHRRRPHRLNGHLVTSLSASPPRLMTCINKSASAWPILSEYRSFGINLLSAEQTDLANRFAGRGGEKGLQRYEGAEWYTAVSGAPLLVDAMAAIDCTVEEVIERHSHAIVIGRIEAVKVTQDDTPLIYWSGDYRTITHGFNIER